jgi:hypothetical protein
MGIEIPESCPAALVPRHQEKHLTVPHNNLQDAADLQDIFTFHTSNNEVAYPVLGVFHNDFIGQNISPLEKFGWK